MDRNSLREILDRENVDPRFYTFGVWNPWDQYCIEEGPAGWSIFFAERGMRQNERLFDTEDEACRELLDWIIRDPASRRVNLDPPMS
jgi:hypothetical protein